MESFNSKQDNKSIISWHLAFARKIQLIGSYCSAFCSLWMGFVETSTAAHISSITSSHMLPSFWRVNLKWNCVIGFDVLIIFVPECSDRSADTLSELWIITHSLVLAGNIAEEGYRQIECIWKRGLENSFLTLNRQASSSGEQNIYSLYLRRYSNCEEVHLLRHNAV